MRSYLLLALLAALLGSGCAAHLPLPMTAAELAEHDSAPAVIAYLGQRDASPVVCDLRARGPHLSRLTAETRSALIDGLVDGKIEPVLWRRCVEVLLKGLPAGEAALVFDEALTAYQQLLGDSAVQEDPSVTERLATLHRLYLERKAGLDADPATIRPMLEDMRAALAKKKLRPIAARFAQELVDTLEVELGTWHGKAVDLMMMDSLAEAGNEMTLARLARRLPSEELRTEARRRIVRIHIALSPFSEVREAKDTVEATVLREGRNQAQVADHPLLRAWLDSSKVPVRSVLVRQHVWQGTATLLGNLAERPDLSVLPELSLWGALWAQLQDIGHPVGLCGHRKDLDPSPCLGLAEVTLDNPFAYLDKGDAFHFSDNLLLQLTLPLAAADRFTIPVSIGGQPAVSFDWGLFFERPEDLIFDGGRPAGAGPGLVVRVDQPSPSRLLFTVDGPGGPYSAVLERADLDGFRIASRGGAGEPGSSGRSGSDGTSGAACTNGGAGDNGWPGANGGDGGDGGDIEVELACDGQICAELGRLLQGTITSQGGPGGQGGSGGAGGSGGLGGSGRSPTTHVDWNGRTVVDDPGCAAGNAGPSGATGSSGLSGAAGRPGRVSVRNVQPLRLAAPQR